MSDWKLSTLEYSEFVNQFFFFNLKKNMVEILKKENHITTT